MEKEKRAAIIGVLAVTLLLVLVFSLKGGGEITSADDVFVQYSTYISSLKNIETLIEAEHGELYRKGLVEAPNYSCKFKYVSGGESGKQMLYLIESEEPGVSPLFSAYYNNSMFFMDRAGRKTRASLIEGESLLTKFEPPYLGFSLDQVESGELEKRGGNYYASFKLLPNRFNSFYKNNILKPGEGVGISYMNISDVLLEIELDKKLKPVYSKITAFKSSKDAETGEDIQVPIKTTTYTFVAENDAVEITPPEDLDLYRLVSKLF
ncbi:hypothetical protein LJC01_01100 [Clostridiaceae bacterium OttesenSCG-928-D20]|nr:hypothetical protein [Clostridiaceae bacterium OttesenSCG-928-D20]